MSSEVTVIVGNESHALTGRLATMVRLLLQARGCLMQPKGQGTFHFAGDEVTFIPSPVFKGSELDI